MKVVNKEDDDKEMTIMPKNDLHTLYYDDFFEEARKCLL